eukprot:4833989-Ditylum_brightwellii.AAC.1
MECVCFVCPCLKTKINHWYDIISIEVALYYEDDKVWETSSKAMKLHPHHQLLFHEWLEKIGMHIKARDCCFRNT